MELVFNFTWFLLATLMVCLWLRFGARAGPGRGHDRRTQLVALAALLLILFPVISVTDDLLAAQNPAEADCCLRRAHVCVSPHSLIPADAALPQPVFEDISLVVVGFAAPGRLSAPLIDHPALTLIQNRPPPSA